MTDDTLRALDSALYGVLTRVRALRLSGTWETRKRHVLNIIAEDLVIVGVVGLVALAIAKELVDQELDIPWTLPDEDDDGLTEPWFA